MKRNNVCIFLLSATIIFSLFSCQKSTTNVPSYTFSYCSGSETDYKNKCYYTDDYFSEPSTTYNASLATASLCLAMSSFASNINKNNSDYTYRYKNADSLFKSVGFTNVSTNEDYLKKPETDTIGVVYAKKSIGDATMIGIGIRGANYQQEWSSNFTLGKYSDNQYHQGFYKAATDLLSGLNTYIADQSITGKIKIWISGYSRAGATANLTSGLLDKSLVDNSHILGDNVSYAKEDVYAYCFEAPQGAYYDKDADDIEVKGENYNNIFNIINSYDPVPKVAMNYYNFTRFGIDCFVSDSLSDPDYDRNIGIVKDCYSQVANYTALGGEFLLSNFKYKSSSLLSGKDSSSTSVTSLYNWNQGLFLDDFLTALADQGVGSRDSYVDSYQEGLRDVFSLLYKNGIPKGSFVEIGMNLVKEILNGDEADILMDDLLHDTTYFVRDLIPLLKRTFEASGINFTIAELLNDLNNLLRAIARVFIFSQSLVVSLISTANIKAVGSAHYPELCLAHMQARDPNYRGDYIQSDMSGRYYKFTSSDTEKSFVIKKNGQTVAGMDAGVVKDCNNSITYGIVDDQFIAYLPVDDGYTIQLSKDATGSVSIYEPSKLRFVDVKKDFDSSFDNQQVDENIKVDFEL